MFADPSDGPIARENSWVMPGIPALPRNSAYSDQRKAALTPTEMRVSMLAAPWRRVIAAARWNGQAAHTTTGEASARTSHCQFVNCSAGTIDSTITGIVSTAAPISRWRRERSSGSSASRSSPGSARSSGGAGSAAV